MVDSTCNHPDSQGEDAEVGGMCRRHYLQEWRRKQAEGAEPVLAKGIEVPCRRPGCPERVHVTGKRRTAYEEKGTRPYHSRECQKLDVIEVICEGCEKPGTRRRSEWERSTTKRFWPHEECARGASFKPRRGNMHTCKGCGEEFYRRPGDETATFHNRECRQKYEAEHRISITCQGCGEPFEVIEGVAKRGRRYHDKACWSLAQIKNRVPGQWHNGKPKRYHKEPGGYILLWEPDRPITYHGWVFEHRYVVEEHSGRFLSSEEEVNHIDEVKTNNSLDNLEILDKRSHASVTGRSVWKRRFALEAELEEYRRRFGALTPAEVAEGGSA